MALTVSLTGRRNGMTLTLNVRPFPNEINRLAGGPAAIANPLKSLTNKNDNPLKTHKTFFTSTP